MKSNFKNGFVESQELAKKIDQVSKWKQLLFAQSCSQTRANTVDRLWLPGLQFNCPNRKLRQHESKQTTDDTSGSHSLVQVNSLLTIFHLDDLPAYYQIQFPRFICIHT